MTAREETDGSTTILLADMDEWHIFIHDNMDSLQDEYGNNIDEWLRRACDGGLTLGGGAAPLFVVTFAD